MDDRSYLDTETVGFHGPIVLLQYAQGEADPTLKHIWYMTVGDVLDLLEWITSWNVIGFNMAFDWFHVCQLYGTVWNLCKITGRNRKLIDCIETYSYIEKDSWNAPCLKPANTLDLMLHARKGPYQSMMDREDIRIKRVPAPIAQGLADYLGKAIPFKDLYFARKHNKKERWKVMFVRDDLDQIIEDLRDVILTFAPSSALKALATDVLNLPETDAFEDTLPPPAPEGELGYAPFFRPGVPNQWPDVIHKHILHWSENTRAQKYAKNDIIYTRALDKHFGYPELSDDDSVLACMVGAVRWRGMALDLPALKELYRAAVKKHHSEDNQKFGSHSYVKEYLFEVLSPAERMSMQINGKTTTGKIILEDLKKWKISTVCDHCAGAGCKDCHNGLVETADPHPVAERAEKIIEYRQSGKEIELYEKLLTAGRFHPSLNVIGALSSRMSGADGLNPQGIKRSKDVRRCFPLADPDMKLDGGDFSGFEVCLADAVYNDPELRKDLLTTRPCRDCAKWAKKNGHAIGSINYGCKECSGTGQEGTKIHALFGQYLFPPKTYDQIYDTKGARNPHEDLYSRSKQGVFALLYGGDENTLSTRVGITVEVGAIASKRWCMRYKVWGQARQRTFEAFCGMQQPGGIGSRVTWRDPKDYAESLLGFKRYFTLENTICRELFKLAEKPPAEWNQYKIKVTRRDREQTASGAARSALLACAFAIQAANMRAAANHEIQSSGAGLTKKLQRRIWDIQPAGVSDWLVVPINIHDEIMVPRLDETVSKKITDIVETFVLEYKSLVPLLKIDWSTNLGSWADK